MNDEQKAYAHEQFKRQTANLPSRRTLAWFELQQGTNPEWVAHKYGYPVETMLQARATLDAQEAAKKAVNA